jgi:SAM-dependent methyltransferase
MSTIDKFPEITDEIVRRYKANYCIPEGAPITKSMVQHHVEIEHQLKQALVSSAPAERADVWIESYDQLYQELPWLAEQASVNSDDSAINYGHFLKLIEPGSTVIEVGSGVGTLARFLTENGRACVATEITAERGIREDGIVTWHTTDGVHLDDFEPPDSYDFVVSTQVIEHLHPDDIERHFRGAYAVLKNRGSYILETPHAFFGPADLSRVLSLDRPEFMHLKEYTHRELAAAARNAGFTDVAAIYIPPAAVRRRFPFVIRSRWLYRYLTAMESLLKNVRVPPLVLRALFFHGNAFLAVKK